MLDRGIRDEIIKAVTAGASLRDAARAQGYAMTTARTWLQQDLVFARDFRKAKAQCKINQLVRLAEAKGWQAPVFLLERKWPAEFGRRKPAAAPAEPLKVDHTPMKVDLLFLPPELLKQVEQAFRNAADDIDSCPTKPLPKMLESDLSADSTSSD